MPSSRPQGIPALGVRFARPTDRLAEVVAFYRDALGLAVIVEFTGHRGYDGVVLAAPDRSCQLEFTSHADGSPCPDPGPDSLVVLYFADRAAVDAVAERLTSRGHRPVASANPYWDERGLTFEDPDGWRVVLADVTAG